MKTGPPPTSDRGLGVSQPKSGSPRWSELLKSVWKAPDPDLVDAGLRGEWLVAGIRLLIVILFLYIPLSQYFTTADEGRVIVLWVGIAALAEALVVYSAVMRSWGRGWIGFFSGILDVTLVTLSLWIYVRLGAPELAVGDLVIFPVYFLALGATSLRYDWRICVLTGVTALAEYLGLVLVLAQLWDVEVSWGAQAGRLLTLALATVLAMTLVIRALEQRSLSNRDRLTALANRGFFDESMMRIGALAARSGEPVAVAMIDVDHFKKFNDTYGHLAGDEALRIVARVLSTSFRTTDLLARYGGEEFAGLFPGLKGEDAGRRLEALRDTIGRTAVPIDHRGGSTRVTISIGVAVWPHDGVNLKEALAVADLRLYQAKQAGRNRLVMSGGSAGRPSAGRRSAVAARATLSGQDGEQMGAQEGQAR
jgi:diguanylate cyclase (GGDEF)-like protein